EFTGVVELEGSVPDIPVTGAVEENGDIEFSFVVESHTQFIPDYHFYFTGSITGNTITGNCEMYEDEKSKEPDKEGLFEAKKRQSLLATVNYGDSITMEMQPDEFYMVDEVFVDWESIGAISSFTFENVAQNHYFHAKFKLQSYIITATSGEGGEISPSGDVEVQHGSDQTFTITPDDDYATQHIIVDGAYVAVEPTYTFENVTSNHTIEAQFIRTYTINASCSEGGTINPAGEIPVFHGWGQSFSISPDEGFSIGNVFVDGEPVGKTNLYVFSNVTSDHTIYVTFIPSFEMIYAPAATFPTESGDSGQATINNPFYIGETEVTYELWYYVYQWAIHSDRGDKKYQFQHAGLEGSVVPANGGNMGGPPTDAAKEPVTVISWRDMVVWCNALSEMSGKEPVYRDDSNNILRDSSGTEDPGDHPVDDAIQTSNNGYRLPTANEWEMSARYIGPEQPVTEPLKTDAIYLDNLYWTPGRYASGATDDTDNAAATKQVAWFDENSNGKTQDVALKTPNALGIYDMSGNVWESTFTGSSAYFKYSRGGSYGRPAEYTRIKNYIDTTKRIDRTSNLSGFRIAH
ncbi:MAG: formylglycine-generating enzyme family protein, partial [Petrotogales bacterium]